MSEVPLNELYPINPKDYGELERNMLALKVSNHLVDPSCLPRYDSLPDNLTLGGIEKYGKGLVEATFKDVSGNERGAWVHLDIPRRQLLLPKSPSVGLQKRSDAPSVWGEGMVTYEVTPPQFITNELHPVVFDHSHPNLGTFSLTDFELAIGERQCNNPVLVLAHTLQFNYMLHRAQDTRLASWTNIARRFFDHYQSFLKEAYPLYDRQLDAVFNDDDGSVFGAIIDNLNGDVVKYFSELATVQAMAEEFKIGFYYSNGDGKYSRFSLPAIRTLVEDLFQKALKKKSK